MKLTKEHAIQEHRKMWNWIADQYENGCNERVGYLKFKYLKLNGFNNILDNCFCCEYDKQHRGLCRSCPLIWNSGVCFENGSEYDCIRSIWDNKERAIISRQIANLPERKC